jgi:actin-related protein
MESDK